MNDYLWDKSGSDREVEALEKLLKPMAIDERAAAPRIALPRRWFVGLLGVAAAGLFAFAAIRTIPEAARPERTIDLGDGLGSVRAEANARVTIVRKSAEQYRLRLDYGTIHASITRKARPRLFQVETPAATCIDLGCQYTLSVDDRGRTHVNVETGRVAFEEGGREVFIPEGASCAAQPGRGAGTPLPNDAAGALRQAVARFDDAPTARAPIAREVAGLVRRPEDCLALWHLMQDRDAAVRASAIEGLVRVVSYPRGLDAASASRLDAATLKAWRDHVFPDWTDW